MTQILQLGEPVCPHCGYSATGAALEHADDVVPWDPPTTVEEALNDFDCLGAEEGELFCPRCYGLFRWDPPGVQGAFV